MNKEQKQAIRQRCEAATEGPWWKIGPPWREPASDPYVFAAPHSDPHCQKYLVADVPLFEHDGNAQPDHEANMDFIAHARQDIPALLDEIERLWLALALVKLDLADPSCTGLITASKRIEKTFDLKEANETEGTKPQR